MSNCICIDVDEPCVVLSETMPRARIPHQCGECDEQIPAGRLYLREVLVDDGRVSSHKTCARCANVRREYFDCGWFYGQLVQDFKDWHGFDYRDGIPKGFAPCEEKQEAGR